MRGLTYIAVGTLLAGSLLPEAFTQAPTEAPAAFNADGELVTNGFQTSEQFALDQAIFEEHEEKDEGLGPVYNAQSCAECHQNPVSGAISQVTELRAGHFDGVNFIDHPGGSLINDRAIDPDFQERVLGGNDVRDVPHLAQHPRRRLRRGHRQQHPRRHRQQPAVGDARAVHPGARPRGERRRCAAAASAGRTSTPAWSRSRRTPTSTRWASPARSQPTENTSNGAVVATTDVADPEDEDGEDIEVFARFMRSTGVPPRDTGARGHVGRAGGQQPVQPDRLHDLPRPHHHDRAGGHGDQRRRLHGAGRARQQDHPPVRRLPAARRGHGRRHRPERRPGHAQQGAHGARCGACAPATG